MNYSNRRSQAISLVGIPPESRTSALKGPTRRKTYTLALIRLADLAALVRSRRSRDLLIDEEAFVRVAAFGIAALEGMHQRIGKVHPGLDILTARDFVLRTNVEIEAEILWSIVQDVSDRIKVRKSRFKMTAPLAGRLIHLMRDERDNLDIRTIEAIDEPASARRARKADEKRKKDRARQRAKRAALAANSPKEQVAIEQAKPWEAQGISRRTWYRRRAKETGQNRPVTRRELDGTDLVADLSFKGVRDASSVTSENDTTASELSASPAGLPLHALKAPRFRSQSINVR